MAEFEALKNNDDPNIPTSSGQHLLMKDQQKIKRALRRTTIVVNSRDRNCLTYPNPNKFRYVMRRPLTNILSIELMSGSIPSYLYNITIDWNTFILSEGGKQHLVTLTPGFYTDSTFIVELQRALNAILGKQNTYTVTQDPNTRRLTFSSTNIIPFGFLFYSGSPRDQIDLNTLTITSINTPATILGFGLNDYASNSTGKIISLLPLDLNTIISRIYLHIEADGKNLSRMELGSGRPDCFHIFYIPPGQGDYYFLNKETDHSLFESSPAPISRIRSLDISLRDEFNRPFELNYRQLNLVLEITHLE
jgi:hypothetical protein